MLSFLIGPGPFFLGQILFIAVVFCPMCSLSRLLASITQRIIMAAGGFTNTNTNMAGFANAVDIIKFKFPARIVKTVRFWSHMDTLPNSTRIEDDLCTVIYSNHTQRYRDGINLVFLKDMERLLGVGECCSMITHRRDGKLVPHWPPFDIDINKWLFSKTTEGEMMFTLKYQDTVPQVTGDTTVASKCSMSTYPLPSVDDIDTADLWIKIGLPTPYLGEFTSFWKNLPRMPTKIEQNTLVQNTTTVECRFDNIWELNEIISMVSNDVLKYPSNVGFSIQFPKTLLTRIIGINRKVWDIGIIRGNTTYVYMLRQKYQE